ncbi:acetoacetate-CoA ligase [Aulographum hederae CBS 113979]|uniref:Acetoacetate-CoA ligase n=1 Tax=Aulographum hederae CBS 113979 TaxID=1176131 RepID=A0A6G1GNE6_9PEZI|nr:acetoacetate-CoA ligase [Aulographum hederae CBS 113979]
MAAKDTPNGVANGTSNASPQPALLWEHPSPDSTPMADFMKLMHKKHHLHMQKYDDLYKWSIDNIAKFWEETWHFTGVKASKPFQRVVDESAPIFPRLTFFEGAKLNFAENLLFPSEDIDEDVPAIIAATETTRQAVSWAELRYRVRKCQASMTAVGVKEGDRIAGYVANHTNALVAMLAATSIGAIWTAVSPDTGVLAVLDRMQQIEPVILFSDNAAFYNGRSHPVLPKVQEIATSLPTLKAVVIFQTVSDVSIDLSSIKTKSGKVYDYDTFQRLGPAGWNLQFAQLPPDHPIYILYSSGTTGAPKCIVHGAIGTLLQHKKEHKLHCSIGPSSRLFYFTTCTWMMWHWLVSGLASGATLILFDGSPFRYLSPSDPSTSDPDDLAMPRLIDELGITHFGTSAKYLSVLEQKSAKPLETLSLKTLEAIYSTGSPLAPSTFAYVYEAFPKRINLGSITGGTDIISLFGAPCPLLPVHAGEIQCLGLGMAVRAFDYAGADVTGSGEPGDLVCLRPFPCMPVMFWPPGEKGLKKYQGSYFELFPGVWHHGDFVRFNPATGGLLMLGRSDGILKPSGVRFGSAEIYNVVLKFFAREVADALCIGRRRETDADETVVLFLKMAEGKKFSKDLAKKIQGVVKKELSARHVPGIVDETPEIPVTTNGKK